MRRYLVSGLAVLAVALAGCGGSGDGAVHRASTPSPSAKPFVMPLQGPVGLATTPDGTVWAAWSGSDAVAPVTTDAPGASG
jgi:hypothetical protein